MHPCRLSRRRCPSLPEHPDLDASPEEIAGGAALYAGYCKICHGSNAIARAGGSVPDLRYSNAEVLKTWDAIVVGGSKSATGMPAMELPIEESQAIRSYVLAEAEALRARLEASSP